METNDYKDLPDLEVEILVKEKKYIDIFFPFYCKCRITSYNVCYTKLLRI